MGIIASYVMWTLPPNRPQHQAKRGNCRQIQVSDDPSIAFGGPPSPSIAAHRRIELCFIVWFPFEEA
jgi:hypothetical protein